MPLHLLNEWYITGKQWAVVLCLLQTHLPLRLMALGLTYFYKAEHLNSLYIYILMQYHGLYKIYNSGLWYIFDMLQQTNQWDRFITCTFDIPV